MTNLRRAVGESLVVGLGGTELTGLERAWLKVVRPAGIILFRRNIADAHQTRALLHEASSYIAKSPLRCVDVEGGTVDRLRDALAPFPSAQAVATADRIIPTGRRKKQPTSFACEHGSLIAQALRAFGFNATLAPVLDLGLPVSAKVMGSRVAASTAEEVTQYARAFLAGLAAHGIAGCAKHFPGLGGGTLDSHLETPSIDRTQNILWQEDLAPYRTLSNELPMVMVSHAAYPATRGKNQPASISRYWITQILRRKIAYTGLVFSDDLEMGGILNFVSIEEAVVACIRAGMDVMEICHSPELILRAYEALLTEAEKSPAFANLIAQRATRNAKLRSRLFSAPIAPALSASRYESLRSKIRVFSNIVAAAQPSGEVRA